MLIIPVVDLFGRQVVHARRGTRTHYRPITSGLCKSSDPLEVVKCLIDRTQARVLYCADLAALQGVGDQHVRIGELARLWPDVQFWVDSGAFLAGQSSLLRQYDNVVTVFGTESYRTITQLNAEMSTLNPDACVLSLDFMHGQLLGPHEILKTPDRWPLRVIVMSLDHVGAETGPCFSLLEKTLHLGGDRAIFAAGGVRGNADLDTLRNLGVRGALVASALHTGSRTPELCNQRDCMGLKRDD